ncbi:hypothetical protein Tco_0706263 [Tanacetum coccineum]|uniref:Tf2-1-like SH3-like domain-containing protein n=1 Tax=Tanacetum coccineum TaxID=301880 RepID=A0ABQ4Y939_9ASTR
MNTQLINKSSILEERITEESEAPEFIFYSRSLQLLKTLSSRKAPIAIRYVGPFKVIERVGEVAYKLELLEELSRVHNTFHVSNLKKCHADEPLAVPLDGLHLDDKLHFVEEPLEIVGREVKRLKRSRILLVKVRWNSKRGPEFTWEREDQFKKKYPHLFTETTSSSSAALEQNVYEVSSHRKIMKLNTGRPEHTDGQQDPPQGPPYPLPD